MLQLWYSFQQQDDQELTAGQPEGRRARVYHVPPSDHELPGKETCDTCRDSGGSVCACVRVWLDTVALTASCPPAVRLQHGDVSRARRQRDRAQPQQQELTVSSRAPPTAASGCGLRSNNGEGGLEAGARFI